MTTTLRRQAGVLVAALLCSLLVAPPAAALHQNCGARYPEGTQSNGHPDFSVAKGERGWAGQREGYQIDTAIFVVNTASTHLAGATDIVAAVEGILHDSRDTIHELGVPAEPAHHGAAKAMKVKMEIVGGVAKSMRVAVIAIDVVETILGAVKLKVDAGVSVENACNSTIAGDMLDSLWVTFVQRSLASNAPPPASLLVPSDHTESKQPWPLQPQHAETHFPWCPAVDLPETLPVPGAHDSLPHHEDLPDTGGTCDDPYHQGFLDAPYLGVDALVTTTIEHAEAHGVPLRDARKCLEVAAGLRELGRYKDAFAHYRSAYQMVASIDAPSEVCS